MKKFTALLSCLFLSSGFFVSVTADEIRLSEPTLSDELTETFGQPVNEKVTQYSLVELAVNGEQYLKKDFILETRIAKVCQKKGCFFIAQEGKHTLRVSFKDYSFFIPTGSSDKTVLLQGRLVQKQLSPEQAKHFNSDLRDGTTELKSGVVYEIVASGVKIPKAA